MTASRSTAAHASVVFLKIPEYSRQPVAEQVRLKDRLEGVVASALAGMDERSRIVLEAPDGAAVVVLGDAVAALEFAQRSSVGSAVPLTAGVSHGPVRVAGGGATPVLLGDAIAVADAVAASSRGSVAATREFREALKRQDPGLARFLVPAGTHTDERDRSYEVFLADRQSAAKRRKRWVATVAVSFVAIVAAGMAARALKDKTEAAVRPDTVAARPIVPARPAAPAPKALATVRLEIKPRGEVFVDGVAKGTSPPLASLQVAPGRHTIEVRHARFPALSLQVDAGPGEELVIRHTFAAPSVPQKPIWERWYDKAKGVFR
jgi:hypothetical protein